MDVEAGAAENRALCRQQLRPIFAQFGSFASTWRGEKLTKVWVFSGLGAHAERIKNSGLGGGWILLDIETARSLIRAASLVRDRSTINSNFENWVFVYYGLPRSSFKFLFAEQSYIAPGEYPLVSELPGLRRREVITRPKEKQKKQIKAKSHPAANHLISSHSCSAILAVFSPRRSKRFTIPIGMRKPPGAFPTAAIIFFHLDSHNGRNERAARRIRFRSRKMDATYEQRNLRWVQSSPYLCFCTCGSTGILAEPPLY